MFSIQSKYRGRTSSSEEVENGALIQHFHHLLWLRWVAPPTTCAQLSYSQRQLIHHAPYKTTMPSKDRQMKYTKAFRFLDIPGELRNQIYRELLLTGKVYEWSKIHTKQRRFYRYQPAILQTNKQIHGEASKVLYDENVWVMISLRIHPVPHNCLGYPEILSKNPDNFRGRTSLKVQVDWINSPDELPQISSLIAPEQLYDLWRWFPPITLYQTNFKIVLNSTSSVLCSTLLDSFRDIRTAGQVSVLGAGPASLGIEIPRLMAIKNPPALDAIQLRVDDFRSRGQQELDSKRPFSAFMAFHEGNMYLSRVLGMQHIFINWDSARHRRILPTPLWPHYTENDKQSIRGLINQGFSLFSGMALSCVRLHTAKLLEARRHIRDAFQRAVHTEMERAQAQFFNELMLAPRKFYGPALDTFDRVVRRLPTYDVVRKELDSLEHSNKIEAHGNILSTIKS